MASNDLQLIRRVRHEVGHLPATKLVPIAAGDVVRLINIVRDEQKRADVAEAKLNKLLTETAEKRLDELWQSAET